MSLRKTEKTSSKKARRKNILVEIADTFKELITVFAMALLLITFVVQTFIIPTGSMANTLRGAHFRLRCPQCGYKYDHSFVPEKYGLTPDTVPHRNIKPPLSRCPSCGYYQRISGKMPVTKGEKILVLKCIYKFFEPRRWDVIVFKTPLEPATNYIKRLIGLPEETVEIIDGDIYINGQISRKPPKVQDELWMPVYDNDYQPVRPREPLFNGHFWQQPFRNNAGSKWKLDKDNPTILHLDSPADQINTVTYDTSIGNNFRATYAYNDVREYNYMPYCSDLLVRFYAQSIEPLGRIGIALSKYQTEYRAWGDLAGDMVIEAAKGKKIVELARKSIKRPAVNKPTPVKFANVDHQLILQFGSEKLTYDLGRSSEDAGPRRTDNQPQVKIFGSGKLTLSHVAIFRDLHYTAKKFANSPESGRATEGNPFTLGKNEYFVLGDNSPASLDSRWWSEPGKGNNRLSYREGVVPREYMVGKALFVFWPGGFKPFAKSPFAIIPNVGQMRFIYGGSNKNPEVR